jgi:hypothetical protein
MPLCKSSFIKLGQLAFFFKKKWVSLLGMLVWLKNYSVFCIMSSFCTFSICMASPLFFLTHTCMSRKNKDETSLGAVLVELVEYGLTPSSLSSTSSWLSWILIFGGGET